MKERERKKRSDLREREREREKREKREKRERKKREREKRSDLMDGVLSAVGGDRHRMDCRRILIVYWKFIRATGNLKSKLENGLIDRLTGAGGRVRTRPSATSPTLLTRTR